MKESRHAILPNSDNVSFANGPTRPTAGGHGTGASENPVIAESWGSQHDYSEKTKIAYCTHTTHYWNPSQAKEAVTG